MESNQSSRRGRPRKYTDKSTAQTQANKNWQANNKEHAKYLQYRSYSRSFIKNLATASDLDELKTLIDARRTEIE